MLKGSLVSLTCSISTLSAWSKVVRLWRSFIASLSSASLRSSIRRSAASSRLQSGESKRGLERCQEHTWRQQWEGDDNSNQRTWRWTWMIWWVVLFCLDLQAESSTPLWLDRKIQDGKCWVVSVNIWYASKYLCVKSSGNCNSDTTEWVSQGPFSRCLSASRSFSLLICCSRRLSSASCRLLCSCRRVHWREGTDFKEGE